MLSMRKLPIPLLIAAAIVTTAVVIILRVTVVPVPLLVDPNFTGPIPQGNVAVWRGAFSEASFVANTTVTYYYGHGFKFAVYAPYGIHNVSYVLPSGGVFREVHLLNMSDGLFLVAEIGDLSYGFKLQPTNVKGFYMAVTPSWAELQKLQGLGLGVVYVILNSGFDVNAKKFFYSITSCQYCTVSTKYFDPAGSGSQKSATIRGYDIMLNVDNKPIVIRTGTAIAFLPSQNTQVTIYVR